MLLDRDTRILIGLTIFQGLTNKLSRYQATDTIPTRQS